MKRVRLPLLALLAAVAACGVEPADTSEDSAVNARIRFNLAQVESATKSVAVNDTTISNTCAFVYDSEGRQVWSGWSEGVLDEIELSVFSNETYTVFYTANCGNLTLDPSFGTAAGAAATTYTIDSYHSIADPSGAVPMSFRSDPVSLFSVRELSVSLVRALSCISVTLDKSRLPSGDSFEITGMTLHNMPKSIRLFGDSKAEGLSPCFSTGDSLSAGELDSLNNSLTVNFYTFENLQGTLLPGNTLQSGKCFGAESSYRDLCTYLEFTADIKTGAKKGPVTYRFYPGEDLLTNFDLRRNTRYALNISPTEQGLTENSWRIDVTELNDLVTSITMNASYTTLYTVGSPKSSFFNATAWPLTAQNRTLAISSSDESVLTVSGATMTAAGEGTAYLIASATDGSGVRDSLLITVTAPDLSSLGFNFTALHRGVGTEANLKAQYVNGITEYPTNIDWEYDETLLEISDGKFHVIGEGSSATIVAKYTYKGEIHTLSNTFPIYNPTGVRYVGNGVNHTKLATNYSALASETMTGRVRGVWEDGFTSSDVTGYTFSGSSPYFYISDNVLRITGTPGTGSFTVNWNGFSTEVTVYVNPLTLVMNCPSEMTVGQCYGATTYYTDGWDIWWVEGYYCTWTSSAYYVTVVNMGSIVNVYGQFVGTSVVTVTNEGNSASVTINVSQ